MLYLTADDAKVDWEWKFFSPEELRCKGTGKLLVVPSALDRLVALRTKYDRPMIITSAYRDPEYNAFVSKTGDAGPHTTGRAFDISVRGSDAYDLINCAISLGFTGIGIQQKGEGRYIHIDDLENTVGVQPRPTIWSY